MMIMRLRSINTEMLRQTLLHCCSMPPAVNIGVRRSSPLILRSKRWPRCSTDTRQPFLPRSANRSFYSSTIHLHQSDKKSSFSCSAKAGTASATDAAVGAATPVGVDQEHSQQYAQLLATLLSINQNRKVVLGVANTWNLMQAMKDLDKERREKLERIAGLPLKFHDDGIDVIHVAGSNGKGSVCNKLARALQHGYGLSTGLFSSPHISSYRERISVDGELIQPGDLLALLPPLLDIAEENDIPVTFFELTTLLALGYFQARQVDATVMEVGLGGRHDSTNVVSPAVTVITSITLEHTRLLGDTLEKITTEKAGIIKSGVPVVLGPSVSLHQVGRIAADAQSTLYAVRPNGEFQAVLPGDFDTLDALDAERKQYRDELDQHKSFETCDEENQAIVRATLAALGLPPEPNSEGLEVALKSLPPCRFQEVPMSEDALAILDVGHNPQALEHLFQYIQSRHPDCRVTTVVGLSRDKDMHKCLGIIDAHSDAIQFVTASDNGRAASWDEMMQVVREIGVSDEKVPQTNLFDGDVVRTVDHVVSDVIDANSSTGDGRKELVVICGSFFIMRDARDALGIPQAVDPSTSLNEQM